MAHQLAAAIAGRYYHRASLAAIRIYLRIFSFQDGRCSHVSTGTERAAPGFDAVSPLLLDLPFFATAAACDCRSLAGWHIITWHSLPRQHYCMIIAAALYVAASRGMMIMGIRKCRRRISA